MTRIHITGNAGSGKTTLARLLGSRLGLPVCHLDDVVWQSGWRKTPADERVARERELVAQKRWVIDGVSRTVREAADVIVLLDISRPVAYLRCAKRNWRYLFTSRPELPPRCPELLIAPHLVRLIWRFQTEALPTIIDHATASGSDFYRIRNRDDRARLLRALGVNQSG